jgi:diacylglycerol kinase (ATP)
VGGRGHRNGLLQSFNYAFQGLVYVFQHQRNMRIHIALAALVLAASLFFNLTRIEMAAVFFAITFVFMAELINTAIEAVVDLVTDQHDPRAKIAKDVAAAAVLVAAVNSIVVAYFVFADKAASLSGNVLIQVRRSPVHLTFVAILLVILLVIVLKARTGTLRSLSGGLPSGHAAVAFAGWTAVTYLTVDHAYGILISTVVFFMAALTAQTRVETGIHTTREAVAGAVLGILLSTLVFQLWY